MAKSCLRMGLGCLVVLGVFLLGVAGCAWLGQNALDNEIARVRSQCTPGNLLEIYREDLFHLRSAQTRGLTPSTTSLPKEAWRLESERARVISSIPFTAETVTRRTVLMSGSQEVAALKFIGIRSPRFPLMERTGLFSCVEVVREFYLDSLEHEFGWRDGQQIQEEIPVTVRHSIKRSKREGGEN